MIYQLFPDGWYQTNTPEARLLGFSDDKFYGQFTKTGDTIYLHYVYSLFPDHKNVQNFLQGLIDQGWKICVILPNERMEHICKKLGFTNPQYELVSGYYNNNEVQVMRYENV